MKSIDVITCEYTDKLFELVAKVYAQGGGNKEAKSIVKEQLQTFWILAKIEAVFTLSQDIRNYLDGYINHL